MIQYRKKQSDGTDQRRMTSNENSNSTIKERRRKNFCQDNNSNSSQNEYSCEMGDDTLMNDSSSDYSIVVKQESTVLQKADSSRNTERVRASRKRSTSINSDGSVEKLSKTEEVDVKEKTSEQLFGDLVAVLLSKKPEKYRNIYMIEIMQVLSK